MDFGVKMIGAATSVLVLAVSGCGDSEGGAQGGGDVEVFCELLREQEQQETVDLDEDFEAGMAELREFRDSAPSAVQADLDVLIEKFQELEDLDAASTGNEEEDFANAFAIILDPEFIAASERLETFGVEQCGLEPSADDGFSLDGGDASVDDGPIEAPVADDGLIREAANVPDPLFDPIFDDDVVDPNTLSIDGLQYFLDVNYTDAPWRTRLASWGMGGGDEQRVSVGGEGVSDAEAVEICAAVNEYLVSLGESGSISISTYDVNENGGVGDETEVISGPIGAGC